MERERRSKLHTQAFLEGYADAYYGKDKRENYSGIDLEDYLSGREDFEEDTLDVMEELNGR